MTLSFSFSLSFGLMGGISGVLHVHAVLDHEFYAGYLISMSSSDGILYCNYLFTVVQLLIERDCLESRLGSCSVVLGL